MLYLVNRYPAQSAMLALLAAALILGAMAALPLRAHAAPRCYAPPTYYRPATSTRLRAPTFAFPARCYAPRPVWIYATNAKR